jgi:hypothetical protein
MNAIEARAARQRAGMTTLEERLRKNPEMAQRIEKQLGRLRLEQQMIGALAPSASAVESIAPAKRRREDNHAASDLRRESQGDVGDGSVA